MMKMRLAFVLSLGVAVASCRSSSSPTKVASSTDSAPVAALDPVAGPAPDGVAEGDAPDGADAAREGCEPEPPPSASCPAPSEAIVQQTQALLAKIALGESAGAGDPKVSYGCEVAEGWLVTAAFSPVASFKGGVRAPCPPAVGDDCGVIATWLVPARGAPRLLPGVDKLDSLDLDGDGRPEAITTARKVQTVWFDGGRKRVQVRPPGVWAPLRGGHVLLDADGDPRLGFVKERARAFRVEPAGVSEAPGLVEELWQRTAAARCPAAQVILPADVQGRAPSTQACQEPSAAKQRLSDEVLRAVTDRARQRGTFLTDGPPTFEWSCNPRELIAVVTYCEGREANDCSEEVGTWVHDVWTERAGAAVLLARRTSGSAHMEWLYTGRLRLLTHADLDGDGDPDPILNYMECEGGSEICEHEYLCVVGGRLLTIAHRGLPNEYDSIPKVVRASGGRADAVVLGSTGPYGEPARAYQLVKGAPREVKGRLRAELLRKADAMPTTPVHE